MSNLGIIKIYDFLNKIAYIQDINTNLFYFVNTDFKKALNNDKVSFEITNTKIDIDDINVKKLINSINYITISGYADVISVIERNKDDVFGVIDFAAKTQYGTDDKGRHKIMFRSLTKRYPDMLIITKSRYQKNKYAFGKFTSYEKFPMFSITNIVGEVNNIEDDMNAVLSQYQYKFEKYSKVETKMCDFEQLARLDENRANLTELNIFSIDGDSTMDIDDAMHIKNIDDELVEIGVHISDVSSVIKFNSDIEIKARHNFSSFYFPNKKTDMIPREYSDNLCSLKEDEYRFAISTIFTFRKDSGNMENVKIMKSLIKNKHKLTYKNVEKVLTGKKIDMQESLKQDLIDTNQIAQKIEQNVLNKKFKHNHFEKSDSQELLSRRLVEVFMILTNSMVAYKLYKQYGKSIMRIHSGFKDENSNNLLDNMPASVRSKAEILNMKRGYYSFGEKLADTDVMHLGIGLKYYTHFTSPIRRYVDLWNHYLICNIIDNKNLSPRMMELENLDFDINQKNDIYKMAYKDLDIINLFHELSNRKNNEISTEGYIIGLVEPSSLVVYLQDLDKIVNIKLINRKLEDIFTLKINEDQTELEVIKNHNQEKMIFLLGQKLEVKMTKNSNQIRFSKRLFFEIINPSYSSWLLE